MSEHEAMSELTCARAELVLAEHAVGEDATLSREMAAHLESCAACLRLARELDRPGVADALGDAADDAGDLAELAVVPPDRYARGREIGRGGMGRIVRARDRRLGRAVAIKELLDDRLRERFEHEARLTARLTHPAIVSVHEAGRWPSGAPFYVMKYVAGKPLDQIIAAQPTLLGRLGYLPNFITVVEAIAYAHSRGIVHRDIKPHNVVIGAFGETVVLDWGLAKELGAKTDPAASPYRHADPRTLAGSGTPAYMPPEQARGEPVDERADVYALGATLHHLIAGRPAVERELPREAPPELAAIIARAMAPDRAQRYRSATELADELKRYQAGQLVGSYRYSRIERVRRFVRRHRLPVALSALFVTLLAAMGALSVRRIIEEKGRAEDQAARAGRALASGFAERGRQHMLAGEPMMALPLLHAALAGGEDTPEVRFLLGGARRIVENPLPSQGWVRHETADSPDGVWHVVAHDGLRVFKGAELQYAVLASEEASSPSFSPDGAWLVAVIRWGSPGLLRLWSTADWKPRLTLSRAVPGPIAFAPDSRRLAVAYQDEVIVYALDGAELASLPVAERPKQLLWTPDGARLLTTGIGSAPATVWDVASGRRLAEVDAGGTERVALTPSGKRLVGVTYVPQLGVLVCDLATGKRLAAPTPAAPLVTYPDGETVSLEDDGGPRIEQRPELVADGRGLRVRLARRHYDLGFRRREQARSFTAGEKLGDDGRSDILFTGIEVEAEEARFDDRQRLLTIGGEHLAALWDLRSGALVRALERDAFAGKAAATAILTNDGELQALVRSDGADRLWDAGTGELRPLELPPGSLAGASADGRIVVTRPTPRKPLIFDRTTGVRHEALGFAVPPSISPDGALLVAQRAGDELNALVYDLAAQRPRATLGLGYALFGASFLPDRQRVITFGWLKPMELRDIDSGRVEGTFAEGDGALVDVALSGDGRYLLVVREDGVARLWSVATQQLLWAVPATIRELARGARAAVGLDAHGRRAFVSGVLYDLTPDPRSAAEIGAMVDQRVPYRIVDGRLLPR